MTKLNESITSLDEIKDGKVLDARIDENGFISYMLIEKYDEKREKKLILIETSYSNNPCSGNTPRLKSTTYVRREE